VRPPLIEVVGQTDVEDPGKEAAAAAVAVVANAMSVRSIAEAQLNEDGGMDEEPEYDWEVDQALEGLVRPQPRKAMASRTASVLTQLFPEPGRRASPWAMRATASTGSTTGFSPSCSRMVSL
jgi:hypothetical protein